MPRLRSGFGNIDSLSLNEPEDCDDEQDFTFRYPSYMFPDVEYDRYDVPMSFKASPDSLFNLCAAVVDSQARNEVFKWSINDVANWLIEFGYPEYEVGAEGGKGISELLITRSLHLANLSGELHRWTQATQSGCHRFGCSQYTRL